jgi:hypothetical protein
MAAEAGAESPALNDIAIATTQDDLVLHLSLEGAFSENVKRKILSGEPTSFVFNVQLSHLKELWFDEKIVDLRVVHSIKFDNLKKEFIIRRSSNNNEAETTPSFDEARKWMSRIEHLRIIPLTRMEKGRHYQLKAKAEISKKTLPLNLQYVLFFLSFWDEETDWYVIEFTY